MDMRESSGYISKVFQKYNGTINTFNPAILHISSYGLNSSVGGRCTHPNIVSIFPKVMWSIARNDDEFRYISLVTIIHELHHCDQIIDYPRLRTDCQYKHYIESIAEMETYLYVANHSIEIANEFNISCMTPYDTYYDIACSMGFETGRLYQRRDYVSHLMCLMMDMLTDTPRTILDKLDQVLKDPNTDLIIKIDNIEFYVKKGLLAMPLGQLNGLMYESFFKYDMRGSAAQLKSKDGLTWTLKIVTNCNNILYKLVS